MDVIGGVNFIKCAELMTKIYHFKKKLFKKNYHDKLDHGVYTVIKNGGISLHLRCNLVIRGRSSLSFSGSNFHKYKSYFIFLNLPG